MRWSCSAAVLCVTLLGVAPDALADGRKQAKAQFAEGQQAFQRKDYPEALRHFRRAFELHEHDAVRFNIGVCLERMNRFREAVAQYEAAAESKTLSKKQRKRANTKADAARAELGTLKVEGTPDGAEVSVEGEVICSVPCDVSIDPRKLVVVIRADAQKEEHDIHPRRQQETLLKVALVEPMPEPADSPQLDEKPVGQPATTTESRGPSWLTWGGLGLVAVGGTGIAVFGPKAKSEHDDFVATGSEDARSSGTTARNLTNVAIGVAVVGAAVVAYDLLILAKKPEEVAARRWATPGIRF